MNTRRILQPTYIKNFKCIGSACEDSCCEGWRVDLDKKTYKKYKKIKTGPLKKLFEAKIKRYHGKYTDKKFGKIDMDTKGRCPFLDGDNLCMIQSELGEEYLSDVCTTYPRLERMVDGQYERGASVSCPEIARMALLDENGVVFEHINEDVETKIIVRGHLETQGHLYMNKTQRYFWDIRMFDLSLLQNRTYSLEERLILMGIVRKQIKKYETDKRTKEIPQLLENMSMVIESGDLRADIEEIEVNYQIQMRLAQEMVSERFLRGVGNKRYLKLLKETFEGVGYREGEKIENVLEEYIENLDRYVKPYLEDKEYVYENYLVNEYYKEMMPFSIGGDIWDSYLHICMLYGMLRLHAVGVSGFNKKFDDELALFSIQAFAREINHNSDFIKEMINLLKDSDLDSLAHMSILIKG
ncbi:MAG: flagellin lysine-N-methylase [Tissierellales bacterium]|jgi:lysine-N-methylase|nr:flagellin lysine-N-methylase [Tissierellales bacterium]